MLKTILLVTFVCFLIQYVPRSIISFYVGYSEGADLGNYKTCKILMVIATILRWVFCIPSLPWNILFTILDEVLCRIIWNRSANSISTKLMEYCSKSE